MITDNNQILTYHLPRWKELPELDLYMDQIISIIDKYLSIFSPEDPEDKLMTPTMINNYVKQRIVSAPVGKKYDRPKVAFFLILALLKRVMSISELAQLKEYILTAYSFDLAYDTFCDEIENAISYLFTGKDMDASPISLECPDQHSAIRAASVAFANKFYIQTLLSKKAEPETNKG